MRYFRLICVQKFPSAFVVPGASLPWDRKLVMGKILCWDPSLRICQVYVWGSIKLHPWDLWSQIDGLPLFRKSYMIKEILYLGMQMLLSSSQNTYKWQFLQSSIILQKNAIFKKVMTILISENAICEWKVSNLLLFLLKHHMNMRMKAKMNLSEWGNEFFNRY